ncbi:MAG: tRNA (adenosine(37)-N6)-dimethylallyltransferase MiaA [Candidatus Baltobacteraceae bacterium]
MSDLCAIVGATASGKSEVAMRIARAVGGEIVGADSRQIYRGMRVGTAAPDDEAQREIHHHCVEFLDPEERYSAARYARDAMAAILDIRSRGRRPIVVGGTGFYLRVLRGEVALGERGDDALRARIAREMRVHPPEVLQAWLALRDPRRAAAIEKTDLYRIGRALEIALAPPRAANATIPTLRSQGLTFRTFGLALPLAEIDRRIELRARAMLAGGLLEEAEALGARAVAADAVGYPQALAYLRGQSTFDETLVALTRATRRYARRQIAWFRAEPNIEWLAADDLVRAAKEALTVAPTPS